MNLEDRYGLKMSTTSAAAASAYRDGVDLMLSAWTGAAEAFDRAVERGLVGLRRPAEPGELAHELQRRGADFVLARRRLEIKQRADIAAHWLASS